MAVHPRWQGAAGFAAVLRILLSATDEWTAALWLTTPSERLRGETAIDVLRRTRGPEQLGPLLAAAREDAARWIE